MSESNGPDGDRSVPTRSALLDAAVAEFASFGYRRASVEGVARRAGLARATVYLHWKGKQDLFIAMVEALHHQHLAAMERVLRDPPSDLSDRLVALLDARFGRFVQLTSSSEYGAELYDVHDQLCGEVTAAADQRADRLTLTLLRRARSAGEIDAGPSGLTLPQLARVLTACAHAAKAVPVAAGRSAPSPTDYRAQLTAVVRTVVHGIRVHTDT